MLLKNILVYFTDILLAKQRLAQDLRGASTSTYKTSVESHYHLPTPQDIV